MADEAKEIMRMTPIDGLALAEKAKGGAPADARRLLLYSAWKNVLNDKGIPADKRPGVFREICEMMGEPKVEIVGGVGASHG